MRSVELELKSEQATIVAAKILGELLREWPIGKRAFVLALEGELGAGKTTFVRGLAKGLGIREKITSPSFLIAKCYRFSSLRGAKRRSNLRRSLGPSAEGDPVMKTAEILRFAQDDARRQIASLRDAQRPSARNDGEERVLWHLDFYRLQRPTHRDLALLNFSDILRDPQNIVAIEWAERVKGSLPREKLTLQFGVVSPAQRHIVIGGMPNV